MIHNHRKELHPHLTDALQLNHFEGMRGHRHAGAMTSALTPFHAGLYRFKGGGGVRGIITSVVVGAVLGAITGGIGAALYGAFPETLAALASSSVVGGAIMGGIGGSLAGSVARLVGVSA